MTPPVTGAIPLCLRLSQAAEVLDLVAVTLEDSTELPQPEEHIRAVIAELSGVTTLVTRTIGVLEALASGRLSAVEVARLE